MARKRLPPIGEEGRKNLKKMGALIDDHYNDALKSMVAKTKWASKKK